MRWIGGLARMLMVTVLVSGLSVYTSWYAVQMQIQQVAEHFGLETQQQQLDFVNMASQLAGQMNEWLPLLALGAGGANRTYTPEPHVLPKEPALEEEDQAVPVWGQHGGQSERSNTESEGSLIQQEMVLSMEEFHDKKDMISEDDKTMIFSILMNRVPQPDMLKLVMMLEDGLTHAELDEADAILSQYLNDEEYRLLLAIIENG